MGIDLLIGSFITPLGGAEIIPPLLIHGTVEAVPPGTARLLPCDGGD
jgi:hypothetical protein